MAFHKLPPWLALLSSLGAAAEELPQPFSAKLSGRPYLVARVEIVLDLERAGDHFKYTMRTKLKAPFLEREHYDCSIIRIQDGRAYPLEHKHTDGTTSKYDAHTRFDWSAGTADVGFGDGRKQRVTGLVWPTWDPVSLQFQVMTDLLNGRLRERQAYRLLELAELSEALVLTEGDENVATQYGELPAIKVVRPHRRSYQLWLSRSHRFMPVKIEQRHGSALLVSDPAQAPKKAMPAAIKAPRC